MGTDEMATMEERIRLKYERIGRNIAEHRKVIGYTQGELAERIGISSGYLGRIERGRCESYSLHILVLAAEALGVPLRVLCD